MADHKNTTKPSSGGGAGGGGGGGEAFASAVGPMQGKREVRRALKKSTNPKETIEKFQQKNGLHSMLAQAFGTVPEYDDEVVGGDNNNNKKESLDTDSVLAFLKYLGVSQYEVHKRISDTLQKNLEDEIRKVHNQAALESLLQNSWKFAVQVPELRPILWAVLKQLGEKTPPAVLKELGKTDNGKLKYAEIFKPLPSLLKRLVWEADWDSKVTDHLALSSSEEDPKQYQTLVQSTLFFAEVQPLIETYCSSSHLVEHAKQFFVTTQTERRCITTQRRALASSTLTSTATSKTSAASLLGSSSKASTTTNTTTATSSHSPTSGSGKAVSELRKLLGKTASGTASYRPKLLHALLSMLMAQHASSKVLLLQPNLHCTLVSDILLSAGGPLPKIYAHLHTLARLLDDAVQKGILLDADLQNIQTALFQIYSAEQAQDEESSTGEPTAKESSSSKPKKEEEEQPSTFLKRQLNRIIIASLTAMKQSDPQNLFLNPVTDAIAPNYSIIVSKPMCVDTMERKIDNNAYNSLQEWKSDVELMFQNCCDYNRGRPGKWFRGEAQRQLKVFKDEILPQSKRLYAEELRLRKPDDKKRAAPTPQAPAVSPMAPSNKKRKIHPEEDTLSMPALASMLLADPFVVRLLLDRALRSLRIDGIKATTIPASHSVVPSVLQLLHMAQWSSQICALRGARYIIPDSGLAKPTHPSLEALVPYDSLRRYLPVLMHQLLEAELDRRLADGNDLLPVAPQQLPRPPLPKILSESGSSSSSKQLQVAIALLEGAFIHVCLPGKSHGHSLGITFRKFSKTLQEFTSVWDETSFFVGLVPALLLHKTRLNRSALDAIVSTWMELLRRKKKKKKHGSMTCAAHEYFVFLLNEWASFGNTLMPRDLLLKISTELVETVNESELTEERKFAALWKANDAMDFAPIKKQYERTLNVLPESHRLQWKQAAGLDQKDDEGDNDGGGDDGEEKEQETPASEEPPVKMEITQKGDQGDNDGGGDDDGEEKEQETPASEEPPVKMEITQKGDQGDNDGGGGDDGEEKEQETPASEEPPVKMEIDE